MRKHTVFISYSRKDRDIAHQLAQDLEKASFDAWWDISDLKGGDAWVRTIQAALKASKYCVVVLSPNAVESEWVEKEYTYAMGLGLKIIPILHENCEVPMALTNIQYIDFRGKKHERGLQELLDILRGLAPDEEGAQPVPTPAKPRRPVNWKKVGAIAVVIAVLTALGTWLVPNAADLLSAWLFETPTVTPTSSPTHMPVILSVTPTNTAFPPTTTPTFTSACSVAPMHGFDSIWENTSVIRERLGCPLEATKKTLPVEESFQNGRMFWCKDTDRIYVVYADGTWQEYEDPWRVGDPQTSCQASPPAGYYQPVRGFGKIWCDQPEVREKIGWAIDVEREAKDNLIQRFEGGIVIHCPHRLSFAVLYSNGTWREY